MFGLAILRIQDILTARTNETILPQLREWLDPQPGIRLLDVGGGTGVVTALLADGMHEAVVLEPEKSRIAYGHTLREGLRFVEAGAENIPFPDASFDRILARILARVSRHHVPDLPAALREIRRVLAPAVGLLSASSTRDRREAAGWDSRRTRFGTWGGVTKRRRT